MYRTVTILKRFMHDSKLPSVKRSTYRPVFVKGSEISPRKADYSIPIKRENIRWSNLKKYGWFTD
jgi:hypothetical protein